MERWILALILLLTANIALAENGFNNLLAGVWSSKRGALYQSDGSNLVCKYIPQQYMEQFAHWMNKNSLTNIRKENSDILADMYLRTPSGEVNTIQAKLVISEDILRMFFHHPGTGRPVVRTFTRVRQGQQSI